MDRTEKMMLILQLLDVVEIPNPMLMYFDYESYELLDEKIAVLEKLRDGVPFDDIPNANDIFELLPDTGVWD